MGEEENDKELTTKKKTIRNKNKPYPCKHCPKTFKRKDTAETHMKIHAKNSEKLHRCENCGKGFAQLGNQRRHQIHCATLPFECKFCPYRKRFLLRQSLLRHLRREHGDVKGDHFENLGDTPFFCKKCKRNFASARGLEHHETNKKKACDAIRRLSCDYCGKRSKTTKYVKIHERIHTGVNTHSCRYCGKLFSQRCNLRTHLKKYHPEESKMEVMESKLELHLEEFDEKPTETEEKPFLIEDKSEESDKESSERKTKYRKIKEQPTAIYEESSNIKTNCRFCSLDLHSKSGGMACEHFFSCDFTTKNFEEYKQHMSIEHEEIVECGFNSKPISNVENNSEAKSENNEIGAG